MRVAVEAWGRARYPDARVMHELAVGGCRIDLAFVAPSHLFGVEIKSSRDTLDRLDRQIKHFTEHLPEVWLAIAERWTESVKSVGDHPVDFDVGRILVINSKVYEKLPSGPYSYPHPARADRALTTPTLHLLWRSELFALAKEHGLRPSSRATVRALLESLARALTGDQIIVGVCKHLRARPTGWQADEPIRSGDGGITGPVQPNSSVFLTSSM